MAGSYMHVTGKNGEFRGLDLIDNPGDAREALEQMHGMIRWLAAGDAARIKEAQDRYCDGPDPDPDLTSDEAAEMWRQYKRRKCDHCGGSHVRACPRVRQLEFHENGKLRSVSFWSGSQWSDDGILWPEEIPGEPPAGD